MRTKAEIERSLAEMKRMADDARRGLAKAKEMNATVLVKHFEQWETKCEARAQILSWVLAEQGLNEDAKPQLPQADVSRSAELEDYLLTVIQEAKDILQKEPQMSPNWCFQLARKDLAEMLLLKL